MFLSNLIIFCWFKILFFQYERYIDIKVNLKGECNMRFSDVFIDYSIIKDCERSFEQHNGILNKFYNRQREISGCFVACKHDNEILVSLNLIDDFANVDYTNDNQYTFLKFITKSKLIKAITNERYKKHHTHFSVKLQDLNTEIGDLFLHEYIDGKRFNNKTFKECVNISDDQTHYINYQTLSLTTMWHKFIERVYKVYKNERMLKDTYTVVFID